MVSWERRNVVLCADNQNVLSWVEHARSHSPVDNRILRTVNQFLLYSKVDVSPAYVRIGRNLFADGLTRWTPEEVDRWGHIEGMTPIDATEQLGADMFLSYNPIAEVELPPNNSAPWAISCTSTDPTTIAFVNGDRPIFCFQRDRKLGRTRFPLPDLGRRHPR